MYLHISWSLGSLLSKWHMYICAPKHTVDAAHVSEQRLSCPSGLLFGSEVFTWSHRPLCSSQFTCLAIFCDLSTDHSIPKTRGWWQTIGNMGTELSPMDTKAHLYVFSELLKDLIDQPKRTTSCNRYSAWTTFFSVVVATTSEMLAWKFAKLLVSTHSRSEQCFTLSEVMVADLWRLLSNCWRSQQNEALLPVIDKGQRRSRHLLCVPALGASEISLTTIKFSAPSELRLLLSMDRFDVLRSGISLPGFVTQDGLLFWTISSLIDASRYLNLCAP